MNTPVCDFVGAYAAGEPVRMHMPGHKGKTLTGPERLDVTEIANADELYRSQGIIRESEQNAAALFGAARTVYSAEGSSLCIRGMLYLAALSAAEKGLPRRLLAGRNAHRTVMTAAALLDLETDWLTPGPDLLSCEVRPEDLEKRLKKQPYMAVWLTSPDYTGRRADIRGAAEVCRKYGVPLLVDNAHGAYLKFLRPDGHPVTLGADACCDSAHKTLSCLTGAAYLHISERAPEGWAEQAERAMAMFASTSPSWVILQSLDRMNRELAGTYPQRLRRAAERTGELKEILLRKGWTLTGDEPMKLTLNAPAAGYTGVELGRRLRGKGIECEFADREHLVLMPSAETGDGDWDRIRQALTEIPVGQALRERPPALPAPEPVLTVRQAMMAASREVSVEEAVGRVMADAAVSCPPAVPVVVAGERITEAAAACMRYYGIDRCRIVSGV